MLAVGLMLTFMVVGLYVFRAKMPPVKMMIYLLITGFCYMMVEIAFISKLELFLESPLTSMALLLAVFLLANGVGANIFSRYRKQLNMNLMPLIVAAVVMFSLTIIERLVAYRLGWPLPGKIIMATLIVAPTGICLGLFFPFVVTWLAEHGKSETVPITYGISTLSSVTGATYAMTMIINLGYNQIVYQAVIGYAALTVLLLVYNRFARS